MFSVGSVPYVKSRIVKLAITGKLFVLIFCYNKFVKYKNKICFSQFFIEQIGSLLKTRLRCN